MGRVTSSDPTDGGATGDAPDARATPVVTGRVRIDERPLRVASRLEPGDIVVISRPDLDRATAQALVAAGPAAVLNAAPSTTGRYPNRGPGVVLAAGVALVDDLGPDVMTLHEGDRVSVQGGTVRQGDRVVASGVPRTADDNARALEAARAGVSAQIEAFAATTGEFLDREADLLLEGGGIPSLDRPVEGRPVLLVLSDPETPRELRRLGRWIRDTAPTVIGVGAGAAAAADAGLRPDVIVGDMDLVPERVLRSGAQLVVRSAHDSSAPGRSRLDKLGVPYDVMIAAGSSEDAAVILAHSAGAAAIVTVGSHASLEDFLDRGRTGMAATFFTRLRAGDRLVSSQVVRSTYRPRVSGAWLALLIVAALLALAAALWSTPWGRDAWDAVDGWVGSVVNSSAGAPGPAEREQWSTSATTW